jgi:hypothetical protein
MAEVIYRNNNEVTLQVKIKLNGSMLNMEEAIQKGVNEIGMEATKEALNKFDTNGQPIKLGSIKMTTKGKAKKEYESPYGRVTLDRHVYQTSKGGKLFCPLDEKARIIIHSTPKFAKMISYKYASLSAKDVSRDLEENHSRHITRGFIQNISDYIGSIVESTQENWEYEIPDQKVSVSTISTSLDGTCVLMKDEGYREAMTGNISLYDSLGERLHTIYLGAPPEYGKESFLQKLQNEIDKIKKKYPDANYIGIADGASSNWSFLEKNTDHHILDFYHATEYLSLVSSLFQKNWLSETCHKLKHDKNAASEILSELKNKEHKKMSKINKESLNKSITYFTNQLDRMNYNEYTSSNFPIGSGVTEAACKTLIKQRLCKSGMKWKTQGAKIVISLRALIQTTNRWSQFWEKIDQCGLSECVDV